MKIPGETHLKRCLERINPRCFAAIMIGYIVFASFVYLWVYFFAQSITANDPWFLRILTTLLCYGLICLPIWVLRRFAQSLLQQWEAETGTLVSLCQRCLTVCFLRHLPDDCSLLDPPSVVSQLPSSSCALFRSTSHAFAIFFKQHRWIALLGYTFGLNLVFVLWGLLQEKIMTKSYGGEYFREPQFVIFCNRLVALAMAFTCMLLVGQQRTESSALVVAVAEGQGGAPLTCYANPALSNILSSWCQYEALLFITFPVQVLSKSCKVIPVMMMDRLLYGRSYSAYEYITTALISIGATMFLLSSPTAHDERAPVNSVSGLVLICCYIALDSYTSTFQGNLFRTYRISSLQMMYGVCSWASLLTVTPLLLDGTMVSSLRFAWAQPRFALDTLISAVCSGLGQMLIFATISDFGAVTFTIIMTIRQCLSILVSCLIFAHPVNGIGAFGLLITFGAVFTRIIRKSWITRKT